MHVIKQLSGKSTNKIKYIYIYIKLDVHRFVMKFAAICNIGLLSIKFNLETNLQFSFNYHH
jgi:hypothetical protein